MFRWLTQHPNQPPECSLKQSYYGSSFFSEGIALSHIRVVHDIFSGMEQSTDHHSPGICFQSVPLLSGLGIPANPSSCSMGLLVMGHGRVTAYSMRETPKPLTCLLIAAGTAAAGVYSVINYNSVNIHTLRGLGDFIFAAASLGVITGIIAYFIIRYVLCPLVILDEERINTVVADYYQLYSRGNRGNYIHFRDDTEIYCVNMLLFHKFRGRIDAPVTYMKYRCPFDVYFIREIQIDARSVEKLAELETDPYTKKQRKIFMFVLVFATVSVAFSLTVAGLAWLASN